MTFDASFAAAWRTLAPDGPITPAATWETENGTKRVSKVPKMDLRYAYRDPPNQNARIQKPKTWIVIHSFRASNWYMPLRKVPWFCMLLHIICVLYTFHPKKHVHLPIYTYIYIHISHLNQRKILNINPWAWRKSGSIPGSLQNDLPKQTNALEVNRWADPPFKPSLVVSASATGRCGNKTQRRPLKMWENFEKCSHPKVCIYWTYHMSHKKLYPTPLYCLIVMAADFYKQQMTG